MNAGFQRQRIQPRVKKSYSKNVGLEVISTTIAKCIQVCLKRLEYQPLLKNSKTLSIHNGFFLLFFTHREQRCINHGRS